MCSLRNLAEFCRIFQPVALLFSIFLVISNSCTISRAMQRDTTDLTAENKELKLRLEAMEQEAQLREDLNSALKEELQRLREQSNRLGAMSGGNHNFGGMFSQLASQLAMQQLSNHPPPQQQQVGVPPHPSDQPFQGQHGQRRPSFMDFNQKK